MWDLPGSRIEPETPALTGRFLTTRPPGNSPELCLKMWDAHILERASLMAWSIKNPPAMQEILQCRRPGFDPWVWKIPWRRKWQSSILTWEFPRTEETGRHEQLSWCRTTTVHGVARVRHNLASKPPPYLWKGKLDFPLPNNALFWVWSFQMTSSVSWRGVS